MRVSAIDKARAIEILKKYNKEEFHLRHGLTVGAVMGYLAEKLGYKDEKHFDAGVREDDVKEAQDWFDGITDTEDMIGIAGFDREDYISTDEDGKEEFDEDLVCYDFSNWWDNMDDIEQVKEYRKHE